MPLVLPLHRPEETFRRLFRRYYPPLRSYAATFVGESSADDVVEEVFANLWKHHATLIMGDRIESYLYRATYTRSMNVLKHRQVAASRLQSLEEINEYREQYFAAGTDSPQNQLERIELRQRLMQAVATLPVKCRQAFRLSYLQDMSNREIAETLDISVRTVETHIYKALKQLRSVLNIDHPNIRP